MDYFRDICDSIGCEDFSAETCQAYLDQLLGSNYDNFDVLVPNIEYDLLNDMMTMIKKCSKTDLESK